MKIFPVGVELFHADERTEMMKLIVAFCNFANLSKIGTDVMSLVSLTVHYYFVRAKRMILCL